MRNRIVGAGVVVLVLLGVGVWYQFFREDAPDAVDLTAASEQLDQDVAEDPVPDAVPDPVESFDGDPTGTWIVDDEIGSFDFETASGSFAGFRVAEELTIGKVTAVGRSGGVTGSLTIADGTLTATEITVDMTTIVSNESRREAAIRRAINATANPAATFVLSEPVELPPELKDGSQVSIEATGDLTVNAITNPVTITIDALIREDGFGVVVGSIDVVWQDFGVTPPSAPIVVSISDQGVVEFQLILAKG